MYIQRGPTELLVGAQNTTVAAANTACFSDFVFGLPYLPVKILDWI